MPSITPSTGKYTKYNKQHKLMMIEAVQQRGGKFFKQPVMPTSKSLIPDRAFTLACGDLKAEPFSGKTVWKTLTPQNMTCVWRAAEKFMKQHKTEDWKQAFDGGHKRKKGPKEIFPRDYLDKLFNGELMEYIEQTPNLGKLTAIPLQRRLPCAD